MKKKRKGLTLIALVVTIIVLLIVVAIAITLTSGENGLFSKASSSSYHNALAELYDRSYAEISYLVIPDRVYGTDNFNFEDLYNSKGFTTFYEIKNGKYEKGEVLDELSVKYKILETENNPNNGMQAMAVAPVDKN